MSIQETIYEAALTAARPAVSTAALVNRRFRRAVHGRRDSLGRFEAWSRAGRDADRPLVWVHAPSVGEALMAQAVIAALRERRPEVQVAFTHFSPSAERVADRVGADVAGYMPYDTRSPVRATLTALRPAAVAFVRTEVWPVVTREAARVGARQLLVNAVLSEESGRLSRLGRAFLETVYRRLDLVGVVTQADGERYERLGVPPGRIRVTGDARFDQVARRVEERGLLRLRERPEEAVEAAPADVRPLWRLLDDAGVFTLVAGSTWPEDEAVLVPAPSVLRRKRALRLVIAPHEPTPSHLEALERRLDRHSLRHARLGALLAAGARPPEVVVVDRLGVLADLYALADAAYVGGGFGTAGLHSVAEPAALGVPVLYGPRHGSAAEAAALAGGGGGFVIEGPGDLEDRLRALIDRPEEARAAGSKARAWVLSRTGAAARNAELIAGCL